MIPGIILRVKWLTKILVKATGSLLKLILLPRINFCINILTLILMGSLLAI